MHPDGKMIWYNGAYNRHRLLQEKNHRLEQHLPKRINTEYELLIIYN